MSTGRAEASALTEGATVVRRDVLDGKVWSAAPFRVITDTLHSRVDQARQQVIALIEARQGPFAGDWAIQQPAPGWPALALPHDTLTAPSPL
jgi:hypothetical protein